MTDTKWTDLSIMDPEFKAFIDTAGKLPSLADLGPDMPTLRANLAAAPKPVIPGVSVPASMDGVEKSRITIPVRDGASIAAVLYRPTAQGGGGRPLVVALHGGGWCIGAPEFEEVNCIPSVLPPGGGDQLPERFRAEYRSYEQNKDEPGLNREAVGFLIGNYNPDMSSPLFAPFNWPTGHKGLPPFFIQVCGLDTLRDEALLYERLLRTECGVETKLVVYPGLPHSFWSFFPHLDVSRKAVGEVVEGFGWLLGKKT
ncbi:hypothetical protein SLS55_007130 [Diplodia seriata]|uniref:Alpha/beta hydrolase fold-3 domain-containing protein n=1 Tax=Diplodia seriata TaxID=420778 RepID=A0ABR3CBH4_9PEZI